MVWSVYCSQGRDRSGQYSVVKGRDRNGQCGVAWSREGLVWSRKGQEWSVWCGQERDKSSQCGMVKGETGVISVVWSLW